MKVVPQFSAIKIKELEVSVRNRVVLLLIQNTLEKRVSYECI